MGTRINITGWNRAFLRCALLFTAVAVLQLLTGNADSALLRHPWGAIIAVNYLYILILAYSKSDQWKWIRSIYDHHSMTASLASMTLICIIFGLCSQDGSSAGIFGALGFHKMTSSWPFLFLLLDFITILGLRSIEDIHHWSSRRHIPIIIHCAVFIIFAAGFFSSSDKQRFRLAAPIGHSVNIATDAGREGELVARWIIEKAGVRKKLKRLWISSQTTKAILDGLVEKDGNIITGKGPGAAMEFAFAIVEKYCGADMVKELKKGMMIQA